MKPKATRGVVADTSSAAANPLDQPHRSLYAQTHCSGCYRMPSHTVLNALFWLLLMPQHTVLASSVPSSLPGRERANPIFYETRSSMRHVCRYTP